MWHTPRYDKTVITKFPIEYEHGFHHWRFGGDIMEYYPQRHDLAMIHAQKFDFNVCLNRAIDRQKMNLKNWPLHNYSSDKELLEKQFKENIIESNRYFNKSKIPEFWKKLLVY